MINRIAVCLLFLMMALSAHAQHRTVGVVSADSAEYSPGYNLFYPNDQPDIYLMDNTGNIVHTWTDVADVRPGNTVSLLADGSIVKGKKSVKDSGTVFWGNGSGGVIEKRDWNNQLLWAFELNDFLNCLHHDFEVLPNGHILALCWERKTAAQALAKGINPVYLLEDEIWSEKIIEIEAVGSDGYHIVWEWHAWDHLVQDFDSTKAGFGNPADFTGRININFGHQGGKNWISLNSINYNPVFDQIVMSSANFNEVWIIDHSTTTEQAAANYGGAGTVGGELMYRWGNPAAYNTGDSSAQKLFGPNDVQWIGKYWSAKDFGKLLVYNNQVGAHHSSVHMIFPTLDTYLWQYQKNPSTKQYYPARFEWTYQRPDSQAMYSPTLSSVQRFSNGNTLICAAEQGYSFEITPEREVVWEYRTPLKLGMPVKQGEILAPADNITPQMTRYALNFPAFTGRDLKPSGLLELPADTMITFLEHSGFYKGINLYPNPSSGHLTIVNPSAKINSVTLYAVNGKMLSSWVIDEAYTTNIQMTGISSGFYFLSINKGEIIRKISIR